MNGPYSGVRVVAVTTIAFGVIASLGTSARPALEVVKMRTSTHTSMSAVFIARTEGYFAQEGLDVQPIEMAAGSALIPALVRGDVDVLPTEIMPAIFNAIARDGRLRIVGSLLQFRSGCAHSGIVVTPALAAGGRLDSAAGLRGLRFSVGTNLAVRYMLDTILRPSGLTSDDLEALEVPESARVEAVKNGRLDLTLIGEPKLSRALKDGLVMWKRSIDVLPDFQYSVILFGPNLLDRRPGIGERFMRAYLRGVRQYLQGKTPRNLELLGQFLELDRQTLTDMCWSPVNPDGRLNTASLLAFQDWLIGRKLEDRALSLSEMIDTRFLEAALRGRM